MIYFKNKNIICDTCSGNSGQAIIMMVMVLGSIMLGATTIAGYITLQKIRTATDITDSAKAIYASDSGIERCFDAKFGPNGTTTAMCNFAKQYLGNGSSYTVHDDGSGIVKSIGNSGRTSRAFGIFLDSFDN